MSERRVRRCLLLALLTTPLVLHGAPGGASEASTDEHCVVTVLGRSPGGELRTTEPVCHDQRPVTRLAAPVVAIHFSEHGFAGSTYTVTGSGCVGGWINLPSGWLDRISSTQSGCLVRHFEHSHRAGAMQVTWSPGGNLTTLDDRTNSVQYG